MVKAVLTAKKRPGSFDLGVFLSENPFCPNKSFVICYKSLIN